ncbi:hypothetical protein L4D88_005330 [Pseudomonas aeruginosa]
MQITSDIELSGAGCTTAITPNQLVQSSSENDNGDEIRISPSGVTSKTGSEATPWLTRKGDRVELTMDGPHVFKGRPLERKGNKHYV